MLLFFSLRKWYKPVIVLEKNAGNLKGQIANKIQPKKTLLEAILFSLYYTRVCPCLNIFPYIVTTKLYMYQPFLFANVNLTNILPSGIYKIVRYLKRVGECKDIIHYI